MLEIIFVDPSFFSSRAYHAKIKSPVELIVGTVKTLRLNKIDMDLPGTMASMGSFSNRQALQANTSCQDHKINCRHSIERWQ
jgi:hypothetical protein